MPWETGRANQGLITYQGAGRTGNTADRQMQVQKCYTPTLVNCHRHGHLGLGCRRTKLGKWCPEARRRARETVGAYRFGGLVAWTWMAPGSDSRSATRRAGGRPRHSTNQSKQTMSFWQVWGGQWFCVCSWNRPIGSLLWSAQRGSRQHELGLPNENMELKAHQEA